MYSNLLKYIFLQIVSLLSERVECKGEPVRCKKEAKHSAAQQMYDSIIESQTTGTWNAPSTPNDSAPPPVKPSSQAQSILRSTVAILQEHLQCNGASVPNYADYAVTGPPHMRRFTVSCTVRDHCELGTGTTKKLAKELAAHNMCVHLAVRLY